MHAPSTRATFFSLDHKTIGIQYAVTALVFLLIGFLLMTQMRWQRAHPGQPVPLLGPLPGEEDAVPGMVVSVWFVPTEVTRGDPWEINCAQLCGLAHFRMRGYHRSMSQPDFDAWTRAELAQLKTGF